MSKKINILTVFFLFCSFEVFSQDKKTEVFYEDLIGIEEKLDFIYYEILERQISDYKTIEKAKDKWYKKYLELNNSTKKKELEQLVSFNDSLKHFIVRLEEKIAQQQIELEKLLAMSNDFSESRNEEKLSLESDIIAIFNCELLLPVSLLTSIRARAIIYELDYAVRDRLDTYINIVRKISKAQDVFRSRVDVSVLSEQKIILNNILAHNFTFLKNQANKVVGLLDIYCFKSTELFDLLAWADGYGVIDREYKEALGASLFEFMPFPFLFDELTNKLDDISYKSTVIECF